MPRPVRQGRRSDAILRMSVGAVIGVRAGEPRCPDPFRLRSPACEARPDRPWRMETLHYGAGIRAAHCLMKFGVVPSVVRSGFRSIPDVARTVSWGANARAMAFAQESRLGAPGEPLRVESGECPDRTEKADHHLHLEACVGHGRGVRRSVWFFDHPQHAFRSGSCEKIQESAIFMVHTNCISDAMPSADMHGNQ